MNKLATALKKLAEELPKLTPEERAVPFLVGEPMYRAIYAPHGEKLEQYGKGKTRTAGAATLGGLLGGAAGAGIASKYFGPKHLALGAIMGLVSGAGLGAKTLAPSAPKRLRESLGEKRK